MACATLANRSSDVPRSYVGICIVRCSPLPYLYNLCLAFAFAGLCLLISRTTLIPLISACVLPVLLHTESVIYPVTVLLMSVLAVLGQKILERIGVRSQISEAQYRKQGLKDIARWLLVVKLRSPRIGLCSLYRLSLPYFTAFNGDFCRDRPFESRIQKPSHAGIFIFSYSRHTGNCLPNNRLSLFPPA